MPTIPQLADLITRLATSTVRQLRRRARELRDRHGADMKGMWGWRKRQLVRRVAEAELTLFYREEIETVLAQYIQDVMARAVIRGIAQGVTASTSDGVPEVPDGEQLAAQRQQLAELAEGKQPAALAHQPGEGGKAPAKGKQGGKQ